MLFFLNVYIIPRFEYIIPNGGLAQGFFIVNVRLSTAKKDALILNFRYVQHIIVNLGYPSVK